MNRKENLWRQPRPLTNTPHELLFAVTPPTGGLQYHRNDVATSCAVSDAIITLVKD